ncbi:crossover junction endodeoxyribonuclease RuvC [bacterium]|nr:crossover junction endodeoxyribonuclease RuvC [bacterium]
MRILGVDPGTLYVGYGVIDIKNDVCCPVKYGRIKVRSKAAFADKLNQIYHAVTDLITETTADVMSVEDVFVSCNAKTSLKLGHARGVILLAAAHHDLPVFEYAPREIKLAVLGRGNASKSQVQWMMGQLLNLDSTALKEDAADGLAVALCHGLKAKSSAALKGIS